MSHATRKQRTLAAPAVVHGRGYFSGVEVTLEFRPAPCDFGVAFVRRDLPGEPTIPAMVGHRVEAPRRTNLEAGGAEVEMVEHVLAALAGLQIDNCEIWTSAAEMPGADGSSLAFVEALDAAGIVGQSAARQRLVVAHQVTVGDKDSWMSAGPSSSGALCIDYELNYGEKTSVGRQRLAVQVDGSSFRRDLAPARTFVLEEEAKWLQSQGLGVHVDYRDLLVFGDDGPIENTLRFPDECVRHKTLDVVGDLALAGCDVIAEIKAHRSGHRLSAELVKALIDTHARRAA